METEKEPIDLTDDGQVKKRIIREGVGTTPSKNSAVSVHYESFLAKTNSVFDSSRIKSAEFTFTLNSNKVVQAWEIAIPTMKVGEIAEIFCTSDYGYGDEGREYIVPRKADLRFEVELLGFWETAKSASERIQSAENKKAEGNELFKKGAIKEALFAYKKSRDYIKELWNCDADELEKCRFLMVAIQLNIAACYLKTKEYDFAIEVCKRALDRDSTSLKAYYRLGQAYFEQGEYDESISFIKLGLQHKPNNAELLSLLAMVEKKKKQYAEKSARIYRKMCT